MGLVKTVKKVAARIPKRPTYRPEGMTDTLPSESEPPVAPPAPEPKAKKAKERPPMPDKFTNGGASAEEREAWIKENWGD
jgi:hypothetical protein